ncbi:MAG: D-2-hydroxyacid dehydrogenase [Pseudomonadota bacterium]
MTIRLGIYEKTLERLGERIRGLGIAFEFAPVNKDGQFVINGQSVAPGAVDLDYLWFSPDIALDKIQPVAFQLALECKSVGVLQTFNAGLDDPVYNAAAAKGIKINNSSAQSVAISEYVLAHVLSVFHPMEERRQLQSDKQWKITPFREIAGTSWIIVGFGPIGRATANLAKAFGATTTIIRRSPQTSEIVDRAGTLSDLPQFLPEADIVVLACPLNAETAGFVNSAFFDNLKPGCVLVNIARGGVVDDAAMIAALDNGKIGAAVLDVFHEEPLPVDNPLWSHPKVKVTGHTSFSGSGTRGRWDELFFENIQRFAKGEPLRNEVNPNDL